MPRYVIRRAERHDLRCIPGIERRAATLFPEADLPGHLRYAVTERSQLAAALLAGRLWIAVCGNERVGYAMADIVDDLPYLVEVDVDPAHGRRGVGSRLVQTVVGWARETGAPRLRLVTFRHLPFNGRFYEKLGFEYVDAAEHGPELAGLIREEGRAGLDTKKRAVMQIYL